MSLAEEALALVPERGSIRSCEIAKQLGCNSDNVHELLLPFVTAGELIACDVTAGSAQLKDYRHALSAGGKLEKIEYRIRTNRTPPQPLPQRRQENPRQEIVTDQPSSNPNNGARRSAGKEEQVSTPKKVVAALRAHGPMTQGELRKHVDASSLSVAVAQLRASGEVKRLGGGARSSIYGLPGQKLPGESAPADAPAPKPKAPKKRAGGGQAQATQGVEDAPGCPRGGEIRPRHRHAERLPARDHSRWLAAAARPGEARRAERRGDARGC